MRLGAPTPSHTPRGVVSLTCNCQISLGTPSPGSEGGGSGESGPSVASERRKQAICMGAGHLDHESAFDLIILSRCPPSHVANHLEIGQLE